MLSIIKPIWNYRGYILGSVKREFQIKYSGSILGALWNVIQPLSMILVYTLIFTQIMKAKLPGVENTFGYSVYLCAGIVTWGLFSEIASRNVNVFIENANLLKKLSFPRLCLPVIITLSAVLNFSIIFLLFIGFLLLSGNVPNNSVLALIPLLLIQLLFSVGLGIVLGVLNVFFRDVGQFFGVMLQFWFWLTPIVYPIVILPEKASELIKYNPMYPLVKSYQDIFVLHLWPDWNTLLYPLSLGLVFCIIGLYLFRKHSGDMVDEL